MPDDFAAAVAAMPPNSIRNFALPGMVPMVDEDNEKVIVSLLGALETDLFAKFKRKSARGKGKVAVLDLTLDSSSDSESDVEILPPSKRSKVFSTSSSKSSSTKNVNKTAQSGLENHRVGKNETDAAEADKARKAKEFATELEQARKMRKKAAEFQKKLDKVHRKRNGIVCKVVIDAKGRTLEGVDDGDNLLHLANVKEILPTGSVATSQQAAALNAGPDMYNLQIKTITYFVNQALRRSKAGAGQGGTPYEGADARIPSEILHELGSDIFFRLFHGTPTANIPNIMETGFKIPGAAGSSNTGAGGGVWLARSPSTSLEYCQGGDKMFVCRVLPGKFTPTYMHATPLGVAKEDFDSFSGSGGDDSIFRFQSGMF
ncbi:hypothetical protein RQP46_008695 [Phenoliferia psychrophenolica]